MKMRHKGAIYKKSPVLQGSGDFRYIRYRLHEMMVY